MDSSAAEAANTLSPPEGISDIIEASETFLKAVFKKQDRAVGCDVPLALACN